jgi:Ca2+-binding RTX toxin-like protein
LLRPTRSLRVLTTAAMIVAGALLTLPAANATAAGCQYHPATKTLSLYYAGGSGESETIVRRAGSTKIMFAGAVCTNPGATKNATVKNTDTISLTTGTGRQTFTIDLSNGPFAPGATAEASGANEIEFQMDLGDGTDELVVNGSVNDDRITFSSATKLSLNGDSDPDVTMAGVEQPYAYGKGGNDRLKAGGTAPAVVFNGGAGDDTLVGGSGRDDLAGGADNDTISGNAGQDSLYGNGGNDVIKGGDGDDYAYGGSGADSFAGGYGDDYFYAESGADGPDTVSGGPGHYDVMSYYNRSTKVIADLDGNADDGAVGEHDRIGTDIEEIDGGSGNDKLTGNNGDNYLYGYAGSDTIVGGAGDDSLSGGDDGDSVHGGKGDDYFTGNDLGNDHLYGEGGDDYFYAGNVNDGDDVLDGGPGIDTAGYYARSSAVWVRLGGGNEGEVGEHDTLTAMENGQGGSGNDTMVGTAGKNSLYGNGGADSIDGGAGADYLSGGAGNDTLTGGDGEDTVYGDDDNDTLHLNDGSADYANCGNGTDVASDRDVYDTSLTGCETT